LNSKTAVNRRPRILFFGEAVTLAHLTRPLALAEALDANRWEVHFACAPGKDFLFNEATIQRWPIFTIEQEKFLDALSKGARLYDVQTLTRYIEDDRRLIETVRPDIVVGDFRLSLAVSAPASKVPYVAIANAHWSPFTSLRNFPVPHIPLTRALGVNIAGKLFSLLKPLVFAYHARPLNKLRGRFGLPGLQSLPDVYTCGDYTLYADIPSLVPAVGLPPNHRYIGPVFWSPKIALPDWWKTLPDRQKIVYITLGSSGQVDLLPVVLEGIKDLAVTALLATAGRVRLGNLPKNVRAAEYFPGEEVSKHARLVICSGGSATAYQALKAGVPVLGIPSNLDQFLTMTAITRRKAGVLLRPERLRSELVGSSVTEILNNKQYKVASEGVAVDIAKYDAQSNFRNFIDGLVCR
jgi:UDP:flavonoid glycosyltransferase YjiC (YdhE family)